MLTITTAVKLHFMTFLVNQYIIDTIVPHIQVVSIVGMQVSQELGSINKAISIVIRDNLG